MDRRFVIGSRRPFAPVGGSRVGSLLIALGIVPIPLRCHHQPRGIITDRCQRRIGRHRMRPQTKFSRRGRERSQMPHERGIGMADFHHVSPCSLWACSMSNSACSMIASRSNDADSSHQSASARVVRWYLDTGVMCPAQTVQSRPPSRSFGSTCVQQDLGFSIIYLLSSASGLKWISHRRRM